MLLYLMFDIIPTFQTLSILAAFTGCPAPSPVAATVELKIEKPVYIQTHSSAGLARMKKRETFMYKGREISRILGFTQGDVTYQYASGYDVQKGEGGACLGMKDIKLTITYSPKVYISSDHNFLGCSFAHVARHERKHYDADVDILTKHLEQIKSQLAKGANAVAARGPLIEPAIETVQGEMRLKVIEAMQPLVKKIRNLRLKAHAAFDTDEAYTRDAKACAQPLK